MSSQFKLKGNPMQRNFGIMPEIGGKRIKSNMPEIFQKDIKSNMPLINPNPPKGKHSYTLTKTETRINK